MKFTGFSAEQYNYSVKKMGLEIESFDLSTFSSSHWFFLFLEVTFNVSFCQSLMIHNDQISDAWLLKSTCFLKKTDINIRSHSFHVFSFKPWGKVLNSGITVIACLKCNCLLVLSYNPNVMRAVKKQYLHFILWWLVIITFSYCH